MNDHVDSKIDILGVEVDGLDLSSAYWKINQWVESRERIYICVAPVSTLVDCQKDQEYRSVVNAAAMVTPDGIPVVWMARLKGKRGTRRVYGPDLMLKVCDEGRQKGYRHYFYGSTAETLDLLEQRLRTRFLNIKIVGSFSPPFTKNVELENQAVIDKINSLKPDILWVGLGSPKQDFWMSLHRDRFDVPVMIGVGAAFDFLAGTKPQAPRWVQRCGLEWFFRFCCEPQRLWRRYLIGNTLFLALVARDLFRKRVSGKAHAV